MKNSCWSLNQLKILLLLMACSIHSLQAKGLDFKTYLSFDEKVKEKLIRRYVKSKDGLLRVELQNYQVYSDTNPELAFKVSVMMEDFHRQFSEKFKGTFRRKEKSSIYFMKDKISYSEAVKNFSGQYPPDWSSGLYVPKTNTSALFGFESERDPTMTVLKHEGLHQLLQAYLDTDIPPWFNEGTACLFETFEMSKSMQMNIYENLYKTHRWAFLKSENLEELVPLSELILIDQAQWNSSLKVNDLYGTSWLLVHALMTSPAHQGLYSDILKSIRKRSKSKIIFSKKLMDSLQETMESHASEMIEFRKHVYGIYQSRSNNRDMLSRLMALERVNPTSAQAKFYRHYYELHHGGAKIENGLQVLEKLEEDGYGNPEMDYLKGMTCLKENDIQEGRYFLRRQLANDPHHELSQRLLDENPSQKMPSRFKMLMDTP